MIDLPPIHYIEGTKEGDEILHTAYPEHIYDPTRRDMVASLMGKEFAKLLGARSNQGLELYRSIAAGWYDGEGIGVTPVHDFWAKFDETFAVKAKKLSRAITAGNVSWTTGEHDINDMTLTWMPFVEERPDVFGAGPWNVGELRANFASHPELHEQAKIRVEANRQQYGFEHTNEPVTVLRTPRSEAVIDGNNRLYNKFILGAEAVNCWTGETRDEEFSDYWISVAALKVLCENIMVPPTPTVGNASASILGHYLNTNSVARTNFAIWVEKDFRDIRDLL